MCLWIVAFKPCIRAAKGSRWLGLFPGSICYYAARSGGTIQMRKTTERPMPKTSRRARTIYTLSFTAAERRRIDQAAKICGWTIDEKNESASFARQLLLPVVAEILRASRPTRGDVLRQRLHSLLH
jgi:hypothetical protein